MDRSIARAAILVVLVAGSCSRQANEWFDSPGATQGRGHRVFATVRSSWDEAAVSIRLDSNLTGVVQPAEVTPGWLLTTGYGSGTAQSSVLLLDQSLGLISSRRVTGQSPPDLRSTSGKSIGYRFLTPQFPLVPFRLAGRDYVACATGGMLIPNTIEVFQIGAQGLETRLCFWNPGSPRAPVVSDDLLVFLCVNNAMRGERRDVYPVAVCAIDLELLETPGHDVIHGCAPGLVLGENAAGAHYLRYFVLPDASTPEWIPHRHLEIRGRTAVVTIDYNIVYLLDCDTGEVRVDVAPDYEIVYERQRRAKPSIPAISELTSRVRVYSCDSNEQK